MDPFCLADFDVLETLGSGSFSTVFKAIPKKDPNRGIIVLKETRSLSASAVTRANVAREVEMLKAARGCPYISQFHAVFVENDNHYMVLEYVPGGDLLKTVQRCMAAKTPPDEATLWRYLFELGQAVNFLHGSGIVHRDIKCQNIMLTDTGHIKLIDLGLAAPLAKGEVLTERCGTPFYMAVEMINKEPYDQRVDVWSIGCVFYMLAQLRPAFNGANLPTLCKCIIEDTPVPLCSKRYSPHLSKLILRMLDKRRELRPSIHEVLAHPIFSSYPNFPPHIFHQMPPESAVLGLGHLGGFAAHGAGHLVMRAVGGNAHPYHLQQQQQQHPLRHHHDSLMTDTVSGLTSVVNHMGLSNASNEYDQCLGHGPLMGDPVQDDDDLFGGLDDDLIIPILPELALQDSVDPHLFGLSPYTRIPEVEGEAASSTPLTTSSSSEEGGEEVEEQQGGEAVASSSTHPIQQPQQQQQPQQPMACPPIIPHHQIGRDILAMLAAQHHQYQAAALAHQVHHLQQQQHLQRQYASIPPLSLPIPPSIFVQSPRSQGPTPYGEAGFSLPPPIPSVITRSASSPQASSSYSTPQQQQRQKASNTNGSPSTITSNSNQQQQQQKPSNDTTTSSLSNRPNALRIASPRVRDLIHGGGSRSPSHHPALSFSPSQKRSLIELGPEEDCYSAGGSEAASSVHSGAGGSAMFGGGSTQSNASSVGSGGGERGGEGLKRSRMMTELHLNRTHSSPGKLMGGGGAVTGNKQGGAAGGGGGGQAFFRNPGTAPHSPGSSFLTMPGTPTAHLSGAMTPPTWYGSPPLHFDAMLSYLHNLQANINNARPPTATPSTGSTNGLLLSAQVYYQQQQQAQQHQQAMQQQQQQRKEEEEASKGSKAASTPRPVLVDACVSGNSLASSPIATAFTGLMKPFYYAGGGMYLPGPVPSDESANFGSARGLSSPSSLSDCHSNGSATSPQHWSVGAAGPPTTPFSSRRGSSSAAGGGGRKKSGLNNGGAVNSPKGRRARQAPTGAGGDANMLTEQQQQHVQSSWS